MVRIAEALEMDNFSGPEKPDYIVYIGVIGEPENVVIGYAGFLFGGKVLCQVGNQIAFHLHGRGGPGETGSGGRINARGMVNKIGVESGCFDLFLTEIPGELVDKGPNHLQMAQFFRSHTLEMSEFRAFAMTPVLSDSFLSLSRKSTPCM